MVVFWIWVIHRKRNSSAPPRPITTTSATPPNTTSASGASQEPDVEMSDVLPSYDAAVVDSNGSATNPTIPPFNPDIYNASEIEDPNLPPPPAYNEVINKSEDYQLPVNK